MDLKTQNDINNKLIEKGDFDELYKQNINLIHALVRRYSGNMVEDYDEALSIANVAFTLALKKYNPEVANFSTFLGLLIRSGFLHHWRDQHASKRDTSCIQICYLDESVYESDGKDLTLQEVLKDDTINIQEKIENQVMLQKYFDYIRQKPNGETYLNVIALRYQGYTQTEIAKVIKCSQVQVCRILKNIAKYIKEYETLPLEKEEKEEKGDKVMHSQNRIQQVKEYLKQGITERQEIAKLLGISATSASTYLSVARREIALQEEKQGKNILQSKKQNLKANVIPKENKKENETDIITESVTKENIVTEEKAEKEEAALTTISNPSHNHTIPEPEPKKPASVHSKSRHRLHLSVVTSDNFNFAIQGDQVKITSLEASDLAGLKVGFDILPELIEDLKELEGYLYA